MQIMLIPQSIIEIVVTNFDTDYYKIYLVTMLMGQYLQKKHEHVRISQPIILPLSVAINNTF